MTLVAVPLRRFPCGTVRDSGIDDLGVFATGGIKVQTESMADSRPGAKSFVDDGATCFTGQPENSPCHSGAMQRRDRKLAGEPPARTGEKKSSFGAALCAGFGAASAIETGIDGNAALRRPEMKNAGLAGFCQLTLVAGARFELATFGL